MNPEKEKAPKVGDIMYTFLDPDDPSKYDYALFGLGIRPEFIDKNFYLNPLL